jgi:hypothetical protein
MAARIWMEHVQVLERIHKYCTKDLFSLVNSLHREILPVLNVKIRHFTYNPITFLSEPILHSSHVLFDWGLKPSFLLVGVWSDAVLWYETPNPFSP